MVVGMGDDPSPGEYERLLLSMKTTARKELVLLHPDRSVIPGSTREWLKVKFCVKLSSCGFPINVFFRPVLGFTSICT